MEWWLWRKDKRGKHTLSVTFVRSFLADVDYRWRVSTTRRKGSGYVNAAISVMQSQVDWEQLYATARGSMATWTTKERHGYVIYGQLVITPPIFRVDTITESSIGVDVSYPIWLQPWLHHHGKRGIFYSCPYHPHLGYQDLDLLPIEYLSLYANQLEIRDRISVAVDAYFQAGKPDERFQDGPSIDEDRS